MRDADLRHKEQQSYQNLTDKGIRCGYDIHSGASFPCCEEL